MSKLLLTLVCLCSLFYSALSISQIRFVNGAAKNDVITVRSDGKIIASGLGYAYTTTNFVPQIGQTYNFNMTGNFSTSTVAVKVADNTIYTVLHYGQNDAWVDEVPIWDFSKMNNTEEESYVHIINAVQGLHGGDTFSFRVKKEFFETVPAKSGVPLASYMPVGTLVVGHNGSFINIVLDSFMPVRGLFYTFVLVNFYDTLPNLNGVIFVDFIETAPL